MVWCGVAGGAALQAVSECPTAPLGWYYLCNQGYLQLKWFIFLGPNYVMLISISGWDQRGIYNSDILEKLSSYFLTFPKG